MSTNLQILAEGCKNNDRQCQQQLYKLCYPDMIRICYRYATDADGAGTIYNDAMLKVFKNIGNYTDEGRLTGWIKTISHHICGGFFMVCSLCSIKVFLHGFNGYSFPAYSYAVQVSDTRPNGFQPGGNDVGYRNKADNKKWINQKDI